MNTIPVWMVDAIVDLMAIIRCYFTFALGKNIVGFIVQSS